MGENKKYLLDGYRFETEAGLETAKKELAKINEIKQSYNLSDLTDLRRAYDLLIDSAMFETPVGISFMREMQRTLAKDPENRRTLRAIPAPRGATEDLERFQNKIADKKILSDTYNIHIKNLRIIVGFMTALVVVLFVYTILDRNVAPSLIENEVTNKYASWQEQLDKEKEALDSKADELREKYPDEASSIDSITNSSSKGEGSIIKNGKNESSGS